MKKNMVNISRREQLTSMYLKLMTTDLEHVAPNEKVAFGMTDVKHNAKILGEVLAYSVTHNLYSPAAEARLQQFFMRQQHEIPEQAKLKYMTRVEAIVSSALRTALEYATVNIKNYERVIDALASLTSATMHLFTTTQKTPLDALVYITSKSTCAQRRPKIHDTELTWFAALVRYIFTACATIGNWSLLKQATANNQYFTIELTKLSKDETIPTQVQAAAQNFLLGAPTKLEILQKQEDWIDVLLNEWNVKNETLECYEKIDDLLEVVPKHNIATLQQTHV